MRDDHLKRAQMMGKPTRVLPMKKRCEVINSILRQRLDTILPIAMRETGFDMWLVLCREDNWDPVYGTLIPAEVIDPKVLLMLVFYDRGEEGIERIDLSRANMVDFYDVPYKIKTYHVGRSDQQWAYLREIIETRDPKRIAINQGEVIWAADGLSATLKENLQEVLPQKYVDRLQSGEDLCRRWLETLSEDEIEEVYPHVVSVAHFILSEVYSRKTIVPGVTTTEDLQWAYWQRCVDLGLEMAFNPSFGIARSQESNDRYGSGDKTIRHGDLVRCDVGIKYLRLTTDTKQWAYVLREGETDVPDSLKKIMADGNRLEDIYLGEFVQGRTGNEILKQTLGKARLEGLSNPRVYSHSLGLFLHEPGPLIGHPYEQEYCTGRGEVELNFNSSFTAELSVDGVVPEWGVESIRLALEEVVVFTRDGARFIDGRQVSFYLI
jgi:hypothetical protein